MTAEALRKATISGLNDTAFGLAVYASQWKLPATTQDSLPVAGPSSTGRESNPQGSGERFQSIGFFLLSRVTWRNMFLYFRVFVVHQ
jgi:hypothetical protein